MLSVEIKQDGVLTREEGYELTKFYVEYFWRINKFYSLKNRWTCEDLVSEIYVKFLEKRLFEKYDASITSKKYHVMNSVRTSLIDLLRKYHDESSFDKEDEQGLTLADKLEATDNSVEDVAVGNVLRDKIFEKLPKETRSKIIGNSPIFGKVNFSLYWVAAHLERGYSISDLTKVYTNINSGRPVTKGRVQQVVQDLRDFILDNFVIYG